MRGLFRESPFKDIAEELAEACEEAATMYERRRLAAAALVDAVRD